MKSLGCSVGGAVAGFAIVWTFGLVVGILNDKRLYDQIAPMYPTILIVGVVVGAILGYVIAGHNRK